VSGLSGPFVEQLEVSGNGERLLCRVTDEHMKIQLFGGARSSQYADKDVRVFFDLRRQVYVLLVEFDVEIINGWTQPHILADWLERAAVLVTGSPHTGEPIQQFTFHTAHQAFQALLANIPTKF